ncbi:MAG TPA: hypothetical protein VG125_00180 [Pirellulales bacterium]|nr:hypothetical protein [Pirellulales bacterium]
MQATVFIKSSGEPIVGPRRSLLLPIVGRAVEGQRRQSVEGAGHVQHLGVGVDVHRQVDLGVPHGGLRRARRNPALGKQTAERVPHGVYVDRPPPFIPLGDAGQLQVAVEHLDQLFRHVKQRSVGRRPRLRYASHRQTQRSFKCARIATAAFVVFFEPRGQIGGEVASNGQRRAVPILFVGRIEHNARRRASEVKLPNGERSQFAAA